MYKNLDPAVGIIPYHLELAMQVYQAVGMVVTKQPVRELESKEYGSCRFELDRKAIVFRVTKITPIKVGEFVTIWKRSNEIILPLDSSDPVDFVVINTNDEQHNGQFIFNKETLIKRGIMSNCGKKGKMAIRVYPPWTNPTVKQAIKTQQWQLNHFFSFDSLGEENRIIRFFS